MSFQLSAKSLLANVFSQAHFGANVSGPANPDFETDALRQIVADLSVEHLRYPGGSLTENCFCITNPDSDVAIDRSTGEEVDIRPISEVFSLAEAQGIAITLVLPTSIFLGDDVDTHGNRLPDIDEDVLRGFLRDVLDGTFGSPQLQSIELGDEYWQSGGMNTFEYGRLAADMAVIVKDELHNHPDAERFAETDILVQMGLNYGYARLSNSFEGTGEQQLAALNDTYGLDLSPETYIYSSGAVAWAKVANAVIVNEFDTAEEQDAIDAVVAQLYSKGADVPNSRYFELSQIDDTWMQEMPDLDIHISEWNLKRTVSDERDTEFGLKQAHEMLNVMEAFAWGGVDAAHVWSLQMDSRTGLTDTDGDIRVPGEMFRLMNETLPGMRPLTLTDSQGRETESEGDTADAHVFYEADRLVTFLVSTSDAPNQETVDFSNIVNDVGDVTITRLGVAEGEIPTFSAALPAVTEENPADFIEDGILIADLAPYEILMIEMSNPTFTPEVESLAANLPVIPDFISPVGPVTTPDIDEGSLSIRPLDHQEETDDPELPPILPPLPDENSADTDPAPVPEDDGDDFGLGAIALALLPLLLLAA
jgi:hypothetical protein